MNLNIPISQQLLVAPINERLIVALDVSTLSEANKLINVVQPADVQFFKIGLEFLATGHYFNMIGLLKARGFKVFADLKFYDIPETVYRATKGLVEHGVDFITVHATPQTVNAAVRATQGTNTKVLAVTVLTSVDHFKMEAMGLVNHTIEDLVIHKTVSAMKEGADGVVCSGQEAKILREQYFDVGYIVTPGIRSFDSPPDDQKRTVTVQEAFKNGADYIVVGRPIRDSSSPMLAALGYQQQITDIFSK